MNVGLFVYTTGCTICIWTIFESGCGIQVSQATPTKFSMLFKHNYGKLSWKFGDHSLNFSFVHGPSCLRVLESIHRYGIFLLFVKNFQKVIVRPCLMSKKCTLLTFKGICMIFLLELIFFILSHPLTSKQPPKVVQIHMTHSVWQHSSVLSRHFLY